MAFPWATGMARHPLAAGQHFNRAARDAQLDCLANQRMWHAVIAAVEFALDWQRWGTLH